MENIKAKIQGILMNSSQKSVIGWTVEEDDFESVAEEIVKNCFIHNVSQQRELLDWLSNEPDHNIRKSDIDEILQDFKYYQSNCG